MAEVRMLHRVVGTSWTAFSTALFLLLLLLLLLLVVVVVESGDCIVIRSLRLEV